MIEMKPAAAPLRRPVLRDIAMCAALFLASRASVMGMYPFGTAFFAACFDKSISYIGIFFICTGLVTASASSLVMRYFTTALLIWIFSYFNRKAPISVGSISCTAAAAMGGAIYALCSGGGNVEIILALIEGIISGIMYIVFTRAEEFMRNRSGRTSIAKEELISVALTAGVLITGLDGAQITPGASLSDMAAVYAVICAAYHCSLGAAGSAGLGIGFMCSMSSASAITTTGFYGICALFGSLLKGFGRFGTALGFLGGAAAAFIYSRFGEGVNAGAAELLIGVTAFLITPGRIHSRISGFLTKSMRIEALNTGDRVRMYLCGRLKAMSQAFSELHSGFCELSQKRLKNYGADTADLFEETAKRACRGCSMAVRCWEKDFNGTYKRLLAILDKIERGEQYAGEGCIRGEQLVNELAHVYGMYRERELFMGEAVRGRDITASQYLDVSSMLDTIASSVESGVSFCNEYEEELITELDKCGITLFEISVIEAGAQTEIYLGLSCGAYVDKLEEIVSRVIGTGVEFESESGGIVKFVTKARYTVTTGLCAVPCDGCSISGDNAEIFDTADSRSFVIISDGMGCGCDARDESEGIVRVLKSFVSAGFDAETAIRTVNSALCLQLDRERAAAIDMLYIDRAQGIARFFKTGSAEAVIIRGGGTETIFPMSAPAGMIEDIQLVPQTRRVRSGDIIVMATDGVTQSGGIFSEWVKNEVDLNDSPEETARRIIKKAEEKWGGAAFDDMTCVIVRISEDS